MKRRLDAYPVGVELAAAAAAAGFEGGFEWRVGLGLKNRGAISCCGGLLLEEDDDNCHGEVSSCFSCP